MKKATLFLALILLLGCLVFPAQADVNTSACDDIWTPETNLEPQPDTLDPALVDTIEIHTTDGRVFEFKIPVGQFDTATITFLLDFIKADDGDELITLYDD